MEDAQALHVPPEGETGESPDQALLDDVWMTGFSAGYNQAIDSVLELLQGLKLDPDELRGVTPPQTADQMEERNGTQPD